MPAEEGFDSRRATDSDSDDVDVNVDVIGSEYLKLGWIYTDTIIPHNMIISKLAPRIVGATSILHTRTFPLRACRPMLLAVFFIYSTQLPILSLHALRQPHQLLEFSRIHRERSQGPMLPL